MYREKRGVANRHGDVITDVCYVLQWSSGWDALEEMHCCAFPARKFSNMSNCEQPAVWLLGMLSVTPFMVLSASPIKYGVR